MTFIDKASELDICYVSTGLMTDVKFDICNVAQTETELILSDLEYGEIRIPLNDLPERDLEYEGVMEVWKNDSIRLEF